MKRRVILIIRDGWGEGKDYEGNAITHAKTPNHFYYKSHYPYCILHCNGEHVGNPEGAMGGSEVGHLTIGAGRIVWQPLALINKEIREGGFFKNRVFLDAINHCKKHHSRLHLDGLLTEVGIHAHIGHLFALLDLCKKEGFRDVVVHLTLDGRDMPEKSALPLIEQLEKKLKELGFGAIASVVGRYYAMDRDKNWDRTRKAYDLIVGGRGFEARSAKGAVEEAYKRGDKTDYYVQPAIIRKDLTLKDNDAFIWYNFRSDRSRQITAMLNRLPYCTALPEKSVKLHYACMSVYEDQWKFPVAYTQQTVPHNLGQVLAKHGLKQLRISETEKYPHVTFFFNSQIEQPNPGEDRLLVPSPKVPSYDQKPEMSAYEITDELLKRMGKYDFILVNYANADLVGHSGVFKAVVRAVEVVDECVGKVVKKALEEDYVVCLMADHGNADHMLHDSGEVDPSHAYNPILFHLISNDEKLKKAKLLRAGLQDIAPTILGLMGVPQPKEMTGKSLISS